ncbi:ABC transporter permease [Boudabousia marimammalium]|uniref:Peptide ABC transporter permease n=1 Tax=Boudabousia marimammalium TaxID=156892 RepID=A0A1Q5PKI8_9ACTO|nr:ABC transporter permease [Boudabousia marimammalium]OKL46730.1 peptide ABC transporter permease [Boudabousia marimammalium]
MTSTVATATRNRRVWASLRHDRIAVVAFAWIIFMLLIALLGPTLLQLAGRDPQAYNLEALTDLAQPLGLFGGISWTHPFGVEPLTGRDLFDIVIAGTQTSVLIGLGATVVSTIIAVILGISAGYLGGVYDRIISRLIDIMLGFPSLIFMIAIGAIIPPTVPRPLLITIIIGIFGWASTARVIRAETLSLKHRAFVIASRASGTPALTIIRREILPNLMATLIVLTTMSVPGKIGAEAALSFLGLGVVPPTPSWGYSIRMAVDWIQVDPLYLTWPALSLVLLTLAFNTAGDALRDALDPQTQRRLENPEMKEETK